MTGTTEPDAGAADRGAAAEAARAPTQSDHPGDEGAEDSLALDFGVIPPRTLMRVLVIDADPEPSRQIIDRLLGLGDIEVVHATTAPDAEHLAAASVFDLILVDYPLPDIDGIELVRRLRAIKTEPDFPMLVLTAQDDTRLLNSALDAGANDFIRKPVEPTELVARTRNMLKLRVHSLSLIAAYDRLRELATVDTLTRTFNRRSFVERLTAELKRARRHGHPVSLLMLDADHFKAINDRHGHAGGDRALAMLGEVCRDMVRAHDFVGRLGGEEFVLALPHAALTGALTLSERLRQRVRETPIHQPGGPDFFMTVSIGVAEAAPGEDVDRLLHRADMALYQAKRAGRDRVAAGQAPVACAV